MFVGCRECLSTGGLTMGRLGSELSFSLEDPQLPVSGGLSWGWILKFSRK